MNNTDRHKYVTILGSCCTGDALVPDGIEAIATAKLRPVLYQGRTTLLGVMSEPLEAFEFELKRPEIEGELTDWRYKMIVDEVEKNHRRRLLDAIELSDALVLDNVSAFIFPSLVDEHKNRFFLKSWEWEKYVRMLISLKEMRIWEIPVAQSMVALCRALGEFYERSPHLSVVFHMPQPAFNNGICFDDVETQKRCDFYEHFNEQLYLAACAKFPRVYAVKPRALAGDPHHRNGAHPFHFGVKQLSTIRESIESVLGV